MNLNRLISLNNSKSPIWEAYRVLRTNIEFSIFDRNIKVILITSAAPEEGKSTTVSNLAITMAQADKRILLIDADLRKPKLHNTFGLSNISGLTTSLVMNEKLEHVTKKNVVPGLDIITSGPKPPNPSEILASKAMKELIEQTRESYDKVLLDSPPIGMVTDPAVLSAIADGTILVIDSGKTHIENAQKAKNLLEKVNANILGVVLNKIPVSTKNYYNYYCQSDYEEVNG
ncbi:CpsD/CapB family tyrosine-protein kinase [Wukongibacter baidiensis]|uniref:CpsD/CapB family tyrosine-protein kinase n=1 Tax=Wukongibacter baidiensis TaxID=1723361 RepID=UPI003D7FC4B1